MLTAACRCVNNQPNTGRRFLLKPALLLHPLEITGEDGGSAARLRVLKRRSDPDGVVASAIPLPEG